MLAIIDPFLSAHAAAVTAAWKADNPHISLQIAARGTGDLASVAGDVPSQSAGALPLRSRLERLNFDWGAIDARILAAFTDPTGSVYAVPLVAGEFQFYANHGALANLGLDRTTWTFTDMETALTAQAAALGPANQAPLVTGSGPTAPNLWAAFIQGLGGRLYTSSGSLALPDAAAATEQLAAFAKRYRWAAITAAKDYGAFIQTGFQGSSALFAFAAPWPIGYPVASGLALQALVPDPFPTFAAASGTPAVAPAGLSISIRSTPSRQAAAARFLAWLFQTAQQNLLMDLGVPPCAWTPELLKAWGTRQAQRPAKAPTPLFQPTGYFDFQTAVGGAPSFGTQLFDGLKAIYSGASASVTLQKVQDEYTADMASKRSSSG